MAGSSNFLQFNPGAVNQETDTQYLSDAQRSGGVQNGQIFNDILANKVFYQITTFVTAFCAMMANKGYVMSDANIVTLQGALANIQTAADVKAALQVIGFGGTITANCIQANSFQINLSGNCTINATNASPGQEVTFMLVQDAAGSHDVAWGTGFSNGPTVTAGPGVVGIVTFIATSNGVLHPKIAGVTQS